MGSPCFKVIFTTIILCSPCKRKIHYGYISGEKVDMMKVKTISPKSHSKVSNAKLLKVALFTL